jgi:hypothetical protein
MAGSTLIEHSAEHSHRPQIHVRMLTFFYEGEAGCRAKTAGTDSRANNDPHHDGGGAAIAELRKCKSSTGQILLDAPGMPAHSLPRPNVKQIVRAVAVSSRPGGALEEIFPGIW